MRAWGVVVSVCGLATGCAEDMCGQYQLATPESDAFYADSPELRYPTSAGEQCGGDFGTSGIWTQTPASATILFGPTGGSNFGTFTDVYIDVSFDPNAATEGATIGFPDLAGEAFTGLGLSVHRDLAQLTYGTITFHDISDGTGSTYPQYVLDIEWDLVWAMQGKTSRYASQGRDIVEMSIVD